MASMAAFFNGEASLPLGGAEALRFLRGGIWAVALWGWRFMARRAAIAVMRRKTGELCESLAG